MQKRMWKSFWRMCRHGCLKNPQSDKVQASFENGVLTLTLPKAEQIRPRTIKVQTKQ